jgi:hypothetical protein
MDQYATLPELNDETLSAAYDEMSFWLYIISDHLKFLRGCLDPTQEELFRVLDERAYQIDRLLKDLQKIEWIPGSISALIGPVLTIADNTRDFIQFMADGIKSCRILSISPYDMALHMIRETSFFIAVMHSIANLPMPPREVLDIPDSATPLSITAGRLFQHLTSETKIKALWEELAFWIHDFADHGMFIRTLARPDEKPLQRRALQFERTFTKLYRQVIRTNNSDRNLPRTLKYAFEISEDFKGFLSTVLDSQRQCDLQTNGWPQLSDHMIRETDYFLNILQI